MPRPRRARRWAATAVLVVCCGCGGDEPRPIGTATMAADGTIVLLLRAEANGIVGDARLTYPPGHAQYPEILRHLDGLRVGETKPVPPWPD